MSPEASPSIPEQVAPVASALLDEARRRAAELLAEARLQGDRELASRDEEAAGVLHEARRRAAESAERQAGARRASARREAGEIVLAARRVAYETLRASAVAALEERRGTPEGERLERRMTELVSARVGSPAAAPSGDLTAVAQSGNRRAVLSVADLVDQVLASLADEVEALWS